MNINPCKEIFLREPVKPGVFRALDNAHAAWQEEPNVGDKYVYFNLKAEQVFGIKIVYENDFYLRRKASSVVVLDEHKYAAFLLRWL